MTDYELSTYTSGAMTPKEWDAVTSMRARGFAICIFNPDELQGAPRKAVEAALCDSGWDAIDALVDDAEHAA